MTAEFLRRLFYSSISIISPDEGRILLLSTPMTAAGIKMPANTPNACTHSWGTSFMCAAAYPFAENQPITAQIIGMHKATRACTACFPLCACIRTRIPGSRAKPAGFITVKGLPRFAQELSVQLIHAFFIRGSTHTRPSLCTDNTFAESYIFHSLKRLKQARYFRRLL